MKKTIALLLLACLLAMPFYGSHATGGEDEMANFLFDPTFAEGATIYSPAKPMRMVGRLDLGKGDASRPQWLLTQWHSRSNILSIPVRITDGSYVYEDAYKTVARDPDGTLTLRVNGSEEYVRVRESLLDAWVHLYFEQRYAEPYPIGDAQAMRFAIGFSVPHFRDATPEGQLNPNVHAVIAMFYIILKDMNEASPSYGNYINFCVMLYDNRTPITREMTHVDTGQNPVDATDMIVYTMDSSVYAGEVVADGVWHHVDFDPLPYFQHALARAQADGCMVGTRFEDLSVTSVFFGFEVPGMMDCEIKVRDPFLGMR